MTRPVVPERRLSITVDLSDDSATDKWRPDSPFIERWTSAALGVAGADATGGVLHGANLVELSVHLVDEPASRALNRDFRGVDRPTNVLSFATGLPVLERAGESLCALGELVICPAVLEREAAEQGKPLAEHWAHLIVHGVLHLAGHDHEDEAAAGRMESLEIRLLSEAGISDPYRGTADLPDE